MAMKPFIDVEVLRSRLGLLDHVSVTNSLSTAIIGSQIYFEELLQTRLMKQLNEDYFKIDSKFIYIIQDGFFRLRLQNAHIREDTPVVIKWADTYPELMSTGGQILADTQGKYFINRGKGVVHIDKDYDGKYFKITYASGFDGAKDAPEWIKEALVAYTPVLLNQQQIFNRSEEQKNVFDTGKEHAFSLLAPYMRDVGFCFRPLGK